jgi:hypothetical protein
MSHPSVMKKNLLTLLLVSIGTLMLVAGCFTADQSDTTVKTAPNPTAPMDGGIGANPK